jgi:hypothetical protein
MELIKKAQTAPNRQTEKMDTGEEKANKLRSKEEERWSN